MKDSRLVCCIVFLGLLIGGCSSKIIFSDDYVFDQDSQYQFTARAYTDGGVAEAEQGYYFLSGPKRAFLYFYDKEKKQAFPVCNKPNCLHTDEPDDSKIAQCNAFLCINASYLQYNSGALYYVGTYNDVNGSYSALMRISPDGPKSEEVLKFTEEITGITIHRGAVYYATTDDGTIAGQVSTTKSRYKLSRLDLDKPDAKPELIDEGEGVYGVIDNILCYGNYVYYEDSQYENAAMMKRIGCVRRYNIRTKRTDMILDDFVLEYTCFNGRFIYTLLEKGIFACDMDGKNSTQLSSQVKSVTANANFLLLDNNRHIPEITTGKADRELTIVDRNWTTVKVVSLKGLENWPLGCSDEYYFIPGMPGLETNEFGDIVSFYVVPLDKTPDDVKVQTFFDFVPKVPFNRITR